MNQKILLVVGIVGILLGISFSYILLYNPVDDDLVETNENLKSEINELGELIANKESTIISLKQEIINLESIIAEREQLLEECQQEIENTGSIKRIKDALVGGPLSEDQTWSGVITVTDHIIVPEGITLNIEPGTMVKFKPYRGYKEPWRRLGFSIQGTLFAVGNPDDLIWFTSGADEPINGDWGMIHFENASPDSVIMYSVIEYGLQGVNVWNSNITINHNIIRWHNWEGVYLESHCRTLLAYNRIYQNGYNGVAMEQYNDAILIANHISESGTNGVHVDASKATIIACNITENKAGGLSVDDHGEIIAVSNTVTGNGAGIGLGEGRNKFTGVINLVTGNKEVDIEPAGPEVEFSNIPGEGLEALDYDYPTPMGYELGYTPSDPDDKYMYVYPDEDETRRVVNKIGLGLGLTWSVAYDGEHIWTAVPWGIIYELDPVDGTVLKQFTFPGPQAWGMTFDGENIWVNDFAERKVYEMDRDGQVLSSFMIPDETGGAKGITWDGEYLYVMGWANRVIYKMSREGVHVGTIHGDDFGGGLAWDGEFFWAPGGRGIAKINTEGRIVGSIYAASEGTWDLAWDGEYLWATQRTNENWMDAKIYQIEILDTS